MSNNETIKRTRMKILCITATKNRHTHLEKLVRSFLDQDFTGDAILLIFNNSVIPLTLDKFPIPSNRTILLFNQHISSITERPYENVGDIFKDALLQFVTIYKDTEGIVFDPKDPLSDYLVTHMDDDDYFLPNHLTAGHDGVMRSRRSAYKPKFSYYRDKNGVSKASNTFESSIFVFLPLLLQHGYHSTNVTYHHKWLDAVTNMDELEIDPNGPSTYIYDWSGSIPTYKTSGSGKEFDTFKTYDQHSLDFGDSIITPANESVAEEFKKLIDDYEHRTL